MTTDVTCTVTVQPPAGKLGTVRSSPNAPTTSGGVLVVPTQVPPIVGLATVTLPGSESVKWALVSAVAFVLPSVKVIVEVPPIRMIGGLKALAIVGVAKTVSVAILEAALAVGVSVVMTPLVVLLYVPGVLLTTCTVTVQPATGRL